MRARGGWALCARALVLLIVIPALASCDSLTRFSRSAQLSGVVDQRCVETAAQRMALRRGHFEAFGAPAAVTPGQPERSASGIVFIPNEASRILSFSVTWRHSNGLSELTQEFSDIGPGHDHASIAETLDFMAGIETAVAGECHAEIRRPVTQTCLAHQCDG